MTGSDALLETLCSIRKVGLLRRNAQTKAHATDTAAMAATTRGAELLRLICQSGWNSAAV
jgi:hypothetical protein